MAGRYATIKRKLPPGAPLTSHQLHRAILNYGSVYQLASDSGVPPAVIYRFVCGERDITLGTAGRLCQTLGLEFL